MSLFATQKKVGTAPVIKAKAVKKTPSKSVAVSKAVKSVDGKRAAAVQGVSFVKGGAIVKPRITEKSGLLSQKGIYTFDVRTDANSQQISAAIKETYKVTPVKISIAPVKSKSMFVRGKTGSTVAGKKAYVYLKKGETIEFI